MFFRCSLAKDLFYLCDANILHSLIVGIRACCDVIYEIKLLQFFLAPNVKVGQSPYFSVLSLMTLMLWLNKR